VAPRLISDDQDENPPRLKSRFSRLTGDLAEDEERKRGWDIEQQEQQHREEAPPTLIER
jgi:hypothetical protein